MPAFLAPLGAKIGFGLSAALLLAVGVLWLSLAAEKRHSEKVETRLRETTLLFDTFKAAVKQNTELARAQDAAHKAKVEAAQSKITVEKDDAIRKRIDTARAAARVRQSPAKTDPGGGRKSHLPGAAVTTSDPPREGQEADLSASDRLICAENTVRAEAWLEWWQSVEAIPR